MSHKEWLLSVVFFSLSFYVQLMLAARAQDGRFSRRHASGRTSGGHLCGPVFKFGPFNRVTFEMEKLGRTRRESHLCNSALWFCAPRALGLAISAHGGQMESEKV